MPRRPQVDDHAPAGDPMAPYRDDERGPRLQRLLADAGVASRRACEELILEGRVDINGFPASSLPLFVDPDRDRIHIDGRPVALKAERLLYVLLNKPERTLTTVSDEPGADRRTVLDLVDHPSGARLFPVGRLDYDTTGLLLLTNDGELANRLTHPRYGIEKTYRAVVKGLIQDEDTARLEEGIYLAERKEGRTVGATRTARVAIRVISRDRDRSTLEITLKEGRNRQVRRMLAGVGCPVKKLERVAMGPLQLKGIARGQWRELTQPEIHQLRRAAKHKPATPGKKAASKKAGVSAGGSKQAGAKKAATKKATSKKAGKPGGGPTSGNAAARKALGAKRLAGRSAGRPGRGPAGGGRAR